MVNVDTVMYTFNVAVLVTLSEAAVMVAVPSARPDTVALPHAAVAHAPVMAAVVESLLDQDTPLVRYMP
jgi:hypothetical protein